MELFFIVLESDTVYDHTVEANSKEMEESRWRSSGVRISTVNNGPENLREVYNLPGIVPPYDGFRTLYVTPEKEPGHDS